MDRSIPLLLIGLIFGGGIGFTLAAANGITLDGHDHSDPAHHTGMDHAAMGHGSAHDEILSLPAGVDAPSVAVEIAEDPATGWNLHILTENFAYAPTRASLEHKDGEGHAHVYVNGVKLGRVYGPWVHLDGLPEGDVEIRVTLNANDHRALAVEASPLEATVTVEN